MASRMEAARSVAMTPKEREPVLADVHVGMIAVAEEERGQLTAAGPTWERLANCDAAGCANS